MEKALLKERIDKLIDFISAVPSFDEAVNKLYSGEPLMSPIHPVIVNMSAVMFTVKTPIEVAFIDEAGEKVVTSVKAYNAGYAPEALKVDYLPNVYISDNYIVKNKRVLVVHGLDLKSIFNLKHINAIPEWEFCNKRSLTVIPQKVYSYRNYTIVSSSFKYDSFSDDSFIIYPVPDKEFELELLKHVYNSFSPDFYLHRIKTFILGGF